jgi:hypothetical protein
MVPATPCEKLLQRLRHQRRDGDPGLPGMRPHPPCQRRGQLDGEHHPGPRNRHPPPGRRLIDIPARLPDRNSEPARQQARRLRRRHPRLREVRGGVDALGVPRRRRTATTHDMKILPDLSPIAFGTPGLLQPAVTQRHIETEVAKCVGGVSDAPYDEVARYVRPPMGRLNRTGDGERCVLTGTTSNPAMYAGKWQAAIPIRFHVAGGPELRAAVAAVTERLTAALGEAPGNERLPRIRPRAD